MPPETDTDTVDLTLPSEPPDGTALYWPEDEESFGALAIRDDRTAALLGAPDRRWFAPNDEVEPGTWDDVLADLAEGQTIDNAIVLTWPPTTAEETP